MTARSSFVAFPIEPSMARSGTRLSGQLPASRCVGVPSNALKTLNVVVQRRGSVAVVGVMRKPLKRPNVAVPSQRVCGTPIPLYAPRRLMARSRAYPSQGPAAGWLASHDQSPPAASPGSRT